MTAMSSKWRFERDPHSPSGFLSQNRPSTDALGVLHRWRDQQANRNFTVTVDEDDLLEAILTYDEIDKDAGSHLDELCSQHGVERHFLNL